MQAPKYISLKDEIELRWQKPGRTWDEELNLRHLIYASGYFPEGFGRVSFLWLSFRDQLKIPNYEPSLDYKKMREVFKPFADELHKVVFGFEDANAKIHFY